MYRKRARWQARENGDQGVLATWIDRSRLNADVPELYEERGDVLRALGQDERALADYDRSIKIHAQPHQNDEGRKHNADPRMACRGTQRSSVTYGTRR